MIKKRYIKTQDNTTVKSISLIILNLKYSDIYNIDVNILNAKDYGVPQTRPRAIIQIYKKHLKWGLPSKEPEITLENSIGHLPSIEAVATLETALLNTSSLFKDNPHYVIARTHQALQNLSDIVGKYRIQRTQLLLNEAK